MFAVNQILDLIGFKGHNFIQKNLCKKMDTTSFKKKSVKKIKKIYFLSAMI
jgi:hypothetical protein